MRRDGCPACQKPVAIPRYEPVTGIVLFWRETEEPYGCLSQWYTGYDGHFMLEGTIYFCAEQAMMAAKARFFKDFKSLRAVLAESHSPRRLKEIGRGVQNFDPHEWAEVAFDTVTAINVAKFSQNKRLKAVLLSTKGILAEASPHDRIWGIGLDASDPRALVPDQWRGSNLLGAALMQVRDNLV